MTERGRKVQTATVALAVLRAGAEHRGDCLLVTTIRPVVKGYIRIRADGEMIMAHRLVVQEREGRALTADETVDHTCHNADTSCPGGNECWHRRCIEPEHLEIVDAIENWRRGRQGIMVERRARTHCPAGHPYEGRNLYEFTTKWGVGRACRACKRAKAAGRDPAQEPVVI